MGGTLKVIQFSRCGFEQRQTGTNGEVSRPPDGHFGPDRIENIDLAEPIRWVMDLALKIECGERHHADIKTTSIRPY